MNFRKLILPVITVLGLCLSFIQLLAQSHPFHLTNRVQPAMCSYSLQQSSMDSRSRESREHFIRPQLLYKHPQRDKYFSQNQPDLPTLNKSSSSNWISLGPEGGYIVTLYMHPTDHNTLYAQTYGSSAKIFKSINGGAQWKLISRLHVDLNSFALDPNNPSIMYGVSGYRLYKSTNEGNTWTEYQIDTNWLCEPIIQINPTNSQVIYIGAYSYSNRKPSLKIYKSTDGGVNWSSYEVLPAFYQYAYSYCFTIDLLNPDRLYIGGIYYDNLNNFYPALFKSIDGGVSWTDISKGLQGPIYDIKTDPTNSNKVYACNYNNIYRSSDGGLNWQPNNDWAYSYKLAIDPKNTNIIYAGYYNSIFRSTDGGVNWSYYTNGLKGLCQSLVVDHTNSSNLYYGSKVGVFKSMNNGQDWSDINSGITAARIAAMALAPSDPQKIYIEFYYNAIFKTSNSGVSWIRLPEFTACGNIGALAVDNSSPDIAFALEESG